MIDCLAPGYGGTRDLTGAFNVSAYSSTAHWAVGIFALIPAREKTMSYTVALVVAVIVVFIVIGSVSGIVIGTAAFVTL